MSTNGASGYLELGESPAVDLETGTSYEILRYSNNNEPMSA